MLDRAFGAVVVSASLGLAQTPPAPPPADNIGHARHLHHVNPKHPTDAPTPARFVTSRRSEVALPLPQEKDAFTFVVFGDRTGGPVDGVKVLADAVRDTNLLEPDLVMTVGDLVNGYNARDAWMEQMREYKGIMGELICPWFPVPGNHDVYWRGPGRPEHEHDADFEMHFGPLWYAFEHKNCWFIALYSDETNPETGKKDFENTENHRMSEEQFGWLSRTLEEAKGADHVFLFLHHPRWIGGRYGNQWDRVHDLLVKAGNVTAVFAGHIHRMRYDTRDGIEYVTLASVGAHQDGLVPEAGWLHHFNVVTVRKDQVAMAAIPVGEVMDVREITADLANECAAQAKKRPDFDRSLAMDPAGGVVQHVRATLANVTTREIDVTVVPDSEDSRWAFSPDHDHARLKAGESRAFTFVVERAPGGADAHFRPLQLAIDADVLMPGHRYALPTQRVDMPIDLSGVPDPGVPAVETAMTFDGDDALAVPSIECVVPDGPFTIECWVRGEEFAQRTGILCKTVSSDYGIMAKYGVPEFQVFLGTAYVEAKAARPLAPGRWAHLAGVYDGAEVRLYVDGALAGTTKGGGKRKTNTLPLMVGADVAQDGSPRSFFKGQIDGVRVTRGVVYEGETFTPARRLSPEDATVILTNMDAVFGTQVWGEGPRRVFGRRLGNPTIAPAR